MAQYQVKLIVAVMHSFMFCFSEPIISAYKLITRMRNAWPAKGDLFTNGLTALSLPSFFDEKSNIPIQSNLEIHSDRSRLEISFEMNEI